MINLLAISLCICLLWSYPVFSFAQSNQNNDNQTNNESAANKKETRKAIITSKPAPMYPLEVSDEEAIVYVRMIFRASGKVTDIHVRNVSPDALPDTIKQAFIRESLKVADQIKFKPAVKEGRPVSQYILMEYHFHP
jgi:hypothetical protein